jgi:uncharacterized repeat protein (TIGR03809 family)
VQPLADIRLSARHGPIMPARPAQHLDAISSKWLDLAERRLLYYGGLYRSGRWRRYYTPESFAERIVDVVKAVTIWRKLAGQAPAADENDLRPAV